ncbi:YhcH/YjgK/YiaL family protein [Catalinimonas alkaloidigena]|uniref:YhcH/YjgK/YiaL family protein n=1 Tax=Catalinimonas alkaloidigena TaxID=1075417 RepID=UPI0024066CE9|nr:YhcH/YjgK/YiaL family protein [Catalinimonas alkaloidigena]
MLVGNGLQFIPHSSINQDEFVKQYQTNKEWWDNAFSFLKSNNLVLLAPGRYVIEEGNIFASVSETFALDIDSIKWEAHKNFNDLQYTIRGKVKMGIFPVSSASMIEPYDSKKYVSFMIQKANATCQNLKPSLYFLRRRSSSWYQSGRI